MQIREEKILETIHMIDEECLDIRTVTMGISLLDCADADIEKSCEKIYRKITTKAEHLVETAEEISREYGIPIVNKRISVTPIALRRGSGPLCKDPGQGSERPRGQFHRWLFCPGSERHDEGRRRTDPLHS